MDEEQTTVADLTVADVGRPIAITGEDWRVAGTLWRIAAVAERIPTPELGEEITSETPGRRDVTLDVGPFQGVTVAPTDTVTRL